MHNSRTKLLKKLKTTFSGGRALFRGSTKFDSRCGLCGIVCKFESRALSAAIRHKNLYASSLICVGATLIVILHLFYCYLLMMSRGFKVKPETMPTLHLDNVLLHRLRISSYLRAHLHGDKIAFARLFLLFRMQILCEIVY